MNRFSALVGVLGVALGGGWQTAGADESGGLKLTVTVVGDKPLPNQAVRLRAEVENVGAQAAADLLPVENTVRVVGVSKDGRAVRPEAHIDLLTDFRRRGPAGYGAPNRSLPMTLAPGDRRAVTFPVGILRTAAHLPKPDGEGVEPLFPTPGAYVLRVQHVYTTRTPRNAPPEGAAGEEVSLFSEVKVEVGEPGKKDEPWTKALARDPGLAATLLQPHEPCTAARAAALRELIEKTPDSTYVNYGRLAIARFHLIGEADPKASPRVNRAMAADALEPAVSRLEYMTFPFLPHVYLNLAEAAPEYRQSAARVLGQDHRTALEWIDFAGAAMSADEWKRFRAEPPRDSAGKR